MKSVPPASAGGSTLKAFVTEPGAVSDRILNSTLSGSIHSLIARGFGNGPGYCPESSTIAISSGVRS
jgi:hypothetical protein